ncbi:MAG: hypothetical protein ACOCY6_00645 [Halodesulfurarchaeum sp.]
MHPGTVDGLRAAIPALGKQTYFNWGASGPSPSPVVSAVEQAREYHEFDAPSADGM